MKQDNFAANPTEHLFLFNGARLTLLSNAVLLNRVDDVRVYNYALTSEQVKLLYNQGSAVRFGPASGNP